MEKNSIQNIIYHANILNYDKAFFQEIIARGLKFDFDKLIEETRKQDEVTSALQFLSKSPKDQINLINSTFQEEEENNSMIGEGNKEGLDKQVKNSIKSFIVLIFKLLSFSKKIITETKGTQQTAKSLEENNITYGLLYLDGLIMINIDLMKSFQVLENRQPENLDQILFSIIEEPLIDRNSQEIASHLLSVYLMYNTKKDILPSFIKLMEWTFSHSIEKNRSNCLTSNFSLLLTNDDCVKYFFNTFEPEMQCIRKLFEYMMNETNINLIYESLFCLWNISNCRDYIVLFENKIEKHLEKIVQVIRTNKIDKVARIGLMIIHNVKESEICMEILFNIKFMRTIDILLTNKWNDQSIKEMLHSIYDYLEKNYKSMM